MPPLQFPRFLLVALPLASIAQFADTSLSIGWVGGPSWRLRDPRAWWSGSDPGRYRWDRARERVRDRGTEWWSSSFCICSVPPTRTVRERFQPADDDRLKRGVYTRPQVRDTILLNCNRIKSLLQNGVKLY
ncbi:hypothetical protein G5I_07555 [Acromyrmex echinatior]|uniref:Secreted protein n=1 Tax=Acromyrmex echinatior TaxID=103372 RepID=F4WP45_ACREC|nr:hypothetical protein G5I_07555 [Acromyrmex echinatior]